MPKGKTKSILISKLARGWPPQAPLLLLLFIIIPVAVVGMALLKLATGETEPVYVKVKVSQGLWWSSFKRPDYWFVEHLEAGAQEKNVTGKTSAQLLSYTYYPYIRPDNTEVSETSYNIYLYIKLNAKKTGGGEYTFKRDRIAVGAPIELNFSSVNITGVIIQMSDKPIQDEYVTKTIHLTGRNAFPWEYEAVKIGDTYFDGKQEVFKVLDKQSIGTRIIAPDIYGNYPGNALEKRRYVTVVAQVKLKKAKGDRLFFGEEQEISIGTPFGLMTPNFNYSFLTISKLE